jgi:glycine/D-amino acid oxidase-like deaminating enzyme
VESAHHEPRRDRRQRLARALARMNAVVIGGGFYGARAALLLRAAGHAVALVEREPRLLARASLFNQARVHGGYHYPRSILTSLRSRRNYARFVAEYGDCVFDRFTHYYAIALGNSKITAAQFVEFCRRIDAPVADAPADVASLFDPGRIERVFRVEECAFNAAALRDRLTQELGASGVDVHTGTTVSRIERAGDGAIVHAGGNELRADIVINATYSALNDVLAAAGGTAVPMKHELTELALVECPAELGGVGVTVMDGPFFSLMPYPARAPLYTLSHVRYTPHYAWHHGRGAAAVPGTSRFPHMMRDAARYLPAIRGVGYRDSLWEVKALMPRSEQDDSRPILFRQCPEVPAMYSVLGAKIDSVYDVEEHLARLVAKAAA